MKLLARAFWITALLVSPALASYNEPVKPKGATVYSTIQSISARSISVLDFGAVCDGKRVTTPGAITSGTNIFATTDSGVQTWAAAKIAAGTRPYIAIAGAGAAGGTLFTYITAVGTNQLTLHDNAGTTTPLYYPLSFKSLIAGGTAYSTSDIVTLDHGGPTVGVKTQSAGVATKIVGGDQGTPQSTDLSNTTLTAVSGGSGTGLQVKLNYKGTGQYVYASDDGTAINAALASAPQYGNITLPLHNSGAPSICGTTISIELQSNGTSLFGQDSNNSQIVALAGGLDQVLHRSITLGTNGGGAAYLMVDAFKGATSACLIEGGRFSNYNNVECRDGITDDWEYGTDGSGVGGDNTFYSIKGDTDTTTFPAAASMSVCNWNTTKGGTDSRIIGSVFAYASSANLCNPTAGNFYWGSNLFDGQFYHAPYGADIGGNAVGTVLTDTQVGNATTAAVHVANGTAQIKGVYGQWNNSIAGSASVVLIDTGTNYSVITGATGGSDVSAANVIVQSGTAGTGTVVCNNANATYSANCGTISQNLVFSYAGSAPTGGATVYMPASGFTSSAASGTESTWSQYWNTTSTMKNFACRVATAPGTGESVTISLRIAGADPASGPTITITDTNQSGSDSTHTAAIVPLQTFDYKVVQSASSVASGFKCFITVTTP